MGALGEAGAGAGAVLGAAVGAVQAPEGAGRRAATRWPRGPGGVLDNLPAPRQSLRGLTLPGSTARCGEH